MKRRLIKLTLTALSWALLGAGLIMIGCESDEASTAAMAALKVAGIGLAGAGCRMIWWAERRGLTLEVLDRLTDFDEA